MSIIIVDRRHLGQVPYKSKDGGSSRRAYRPRRKLHTIVGLGCHHTANFDSPLHGSEKQRIAQAIERGERTPYHVEIFRDLVILLYPWDLVTWHGGLLNYPTIGVAIGGRFAELQREYDPKIHDDPFEFEAAIAAFFEYLDTARLDSSDGHDLLPSLKVLRTHSQTTTKPSDPGEGITRLMCTYGTMLRTPIVGDKDYKAGRGQLWHPEYSLPYTDRSTARDAAVDAPAAMDGEDPRNGAVS